MSRLTIVGAGHVGKRFGNLIVANRVVDVLQIHDRDIARAAAAEFVGAGRPFHHSSSDASLSSDACRPSADLSRLQDGRIDLARRQPESRHASAMVRRADIRAKSLIERRQQIPVFPVE